MDIEAALDELFALPLEGFTEARNSLAKELSDEGKKNDAARVKALKKPTITVWAVNQLAHRHGPELEELVRIHEQMAAAKGSKELRQAAEKRRGVVRRLTDLAAIALEDSGHSATSTTTQRISQTLLAAISGEQLDALRWGRLTGDIEGTGFSAMSGWAEAADAEPEKKIDRRSEERVEKLSRAAEEAAREAAKLTRSAAAAEQEARRLEAKAQRAQKKADDARKKAEEARHKAEDAARRI